MSAICRSIFALLCLCALGGCIGGPPPPGPIPSRELRAGTEHRRLVVVLPGRGDDLKSLDRFGVAPAIQQGLPGSDVTLVELTLRYYAEGRAVERLRTEIIEPARARGYREIWLLGASMGALGVMMYEREYPGELTGIILLAPYMGERNLIAEISAAGGLSRWQAGPVPSERTMSNVPREQWRVAQTWSSQPQRQQSVWLVCGDEDRLRYASELLATALPREHYVQLPGKHLWSVWLQGANDVFRRIESMR